MKILADQNIPLIDELFGPLGTIQRLPGRDMTPADLEGVDVLLVRSVTQVNRHLLSNNPIQFVGSCTIGTDHLDIPFLNQHHIAWANAPGCNSRAVVQYVFSAMSALKPRWRDLSIGIIGCGNIGHRLYQKLKRLNVTCVCYDPLVQDGTNSDFVSLDEVLCADIITCHVPLTRDGQYPTFHLLGEAELRKLKPNTLLINASRGAVIDNDALLNILQKHSLQVVLDVWENEPSISLALLDKVALGTVHIAGHSLEGKEMGTFMVYKAFCEFLGTHDENAGRQYLSHDRAALDTTFSSTLAGDLFNELLLACYDIRQDDYHLRQYLQGANEQTIGDYFDRLRKQYSVRREYHHFEISQLNIAQAIKNWFQVLQQ